MKNNQCRFSNDLFGNYCKPNICVQYSWLVSHFQYVLVFGGCFVFNMTGVVT